MILYSFMFVLCRAPSYLSTSFDAIHFHQRYKTFYKYDVFNQVDDLKRHVRARSLHANHPQPSLTSTYTPPYTTTNLLRLIAHQPTVSQGTTIKTNNKLTKRKNLTHSLHHVQNRNCQALERRAWFRPHRSRRKSARYLRPPLKRNLMKIF